MIGRMYRKILTILYKIFNPYVRNAVLYSIPNVYFKKRLKLGNKVHINDSVFINAVAGVEIGDYSVLSHGVTILSTGLDTSRWIGRKYDEDIHVNKCVKIGKNVWLGANVTVCPGAIVPDDSIVAAGSVVTKKLIEKRCLYGGVPAKKLKEL